MFRDHQMETSTNYSKIVPDRENFDREVSRPLNREAPRPAVGSILRHTPLLRDVPDEILTIIASMCVPKVLGKGEYLFYEGGMAQGFYVVQRGAIKLHRITFDGKERVLHICRPFESFAEEVVYSEDGFAVNASAIEESQVLMIRKKEFLMLLKREPHLVLNVLRSMNRQFENLMALLNDLTLKDVTTRLLAWLLQRCPDPTSSEPYEIHLLQPKRQLAAELGTVSETFSRTLAKFREQKLILIDRNVVTLLSPNRISQLLSRGSFRRSHNGSGGLTARRTETTPSERVRLFSEQANLVTA